MEQEVKKEPKVLSKATQVQQSLITTYKKTIYSKFTAAIKEYNLIEDGDKIAVCISGGKDSFLLATLLKNLKKYGKNNFDLVFLAIDPGYNPFNRKILEDNTRLLEIDLQIVDVNIFDYVASIKEGSPCYVCARMRRGWLYSAAKNLGCNKIALGHHFDDVVETTLLSMLYNGQFKTMPPKLHSDNFENMQLIRPLYKVREKDILNWKNKNNLLFQNCGCRFVEICERDGTKSDSSKRKQVKNLIAQLEQTNDVFANNIFNSIHNVNLDTLIGWQQDGTKHNFLDNFDNKKSKKN
ncbi:MAG: tRNA 2-thiocytidine biosynthesis TtcA family protein [Christensenellales bacterium]|jgi:tRNA 2-thiocytidine biosynthesis protein TtcA